MQKLLTRIVKAPLTYIADLRAITFKQYLHIHTNFSPSYPIMICTSLIFTLMLSGTILYDVFNNPLNGKCFENAKVGAYIIAVLYPIESILCFICLTGTIALSKSKCWKVSWILLFGPIISGFGFGEVGLVELCALSSGQNQLIRTPEIIKRPGFIDAIVYLYISFFVMYFVLVPSINYLYQRQQIDQKSKSKSKQKQEQKSNQKPKDTDKPVQSEKDNKSCCSKFVTVLYYILNTILVISVVFLLFIKILGPIIFTVIWIELAANSQYITSNIQRMILAFSILAYFAPLSLMIITIGIQRIFKLGKDKKGQTQGKQQEVTEKRTIDLQESQQGRVTVSSRKSNVSRISKRQASSMREQIQLDQEVNQPRALTGKSNIIKEALL